MTEIATIVLPVFIIIALGFYLKKIEFIDVTFTKQLNRLIYYVALPALLFYKIGGANFLTSFNPTLIAIIFATTIIIFFTTFIFARMRGYTPMQQGAFCQGSFRGNLAFIGLALVYNAYGESGLTTAGIVIGFLVPLLNFLSVIALSLPDNHKKRSLSKSFWFHQILLNPLIVASLLGIGWSILDIQFPEILSISFDILTGMSLPLALLSIGATFSPQKLRGDIWKMVAVTSIKIILLPLLTGVLLYAFGIRGQELGVGVLLAGAPTATASYIMAQLLHSDAELTSGIIMLSTLCSIFTYSASLYILSLL